MIVGECLPENRKRIEVEATKGRILDRRAFLKLAAAATLPLAMPVGRLGSVVRAAALSQCEEEAEEALPPTPLGRIATWWQQAVRATPTLDGEWIATKRRDDVIPLYAAVNGEAPWPTNSVWYRTDEGYIHSGYVHLVRDEPQAVVRTVAEPGFWAQVAQPWAEARWSVASPYVAAKLYYETVYRVVAMVLDESGVAWYQLKEGYTPWRPSVFVPATSLRPLPRQELAPLSPGVPDKVIEIDRTAQTVTCVEGSQVVFSTPAATGYWQTATPRGEFTVLYKRHTRRMNVQNISDPYDLPGVAFPVYFTWSGVAIHGTYWHNDYGRVHSHGCVNVSADAARWILRWVDPVISYEAYEQKADAEAKGTRVVVF